MEDKEEQLLLSLQSLHLHEQQIPIEESWPSLNEVEKILGYKFKKRELLKEALTHNSYKEGDHPSYERLEFVGDSILNLLVSKEHYLLYPDLPPGKLTRLRSANVDTEKLARAAALHELDKYLRHKKPFLDGQIREFKDAIKEYPLHSYGLIDAPKDLADVMESVIGAVFIDCDFSMDITWKVVKDMLEPIITPDLLQTHPVTKLYEFCQKNSLKLKFVDSWAEAGEIKAFINGELIASGIYGSKKPIALNRAADNAYAEITTRLGVVDVKNDHD